MNTAAGENWTSSDLRPYVEHALDCFGADRLMFGGDWPVAILNGDYASVVAATREIIAPLDQREQAAVMGGTAIEVYGLTDGAQA